jgi:hypothetical protein
MEMCASIRVSSLHLVNGSWEDSSSRAIPKTTTLFYTCVENHGIQICARESDLLLQTMGGTVSLASDWAPPEVRKGGYTTLKEYYSHISFVILAGLLQEVIIQQQ